ncbi:fructose 1,6-bisphosphatase II [compost metagenome]
MRLFCVKKLSVNVNSCGKPLSFKRRDVRGFVWISDEWFQRIRFLSGHRAEAHSVVMRSVTKTIRFVHSIHHTTNVSGTFAVRVFTSFLRVKSPKP